MILVLFTVLIEMAASRGVVAVPRELRHHRAVDVLDQHPDAAGHRRRHRLHDLPPRPLPRERATPARTARPPTTTCTAGTAHVILGSGLTIAGAVFCLTFTRLPYFQSLGIPAAIGVLVALVAALTLAPAVI